MSNRDDIRIERKPEVLARTGLARSTLHHRIKNGLFVPPVSLGGDRAVGWPSHEVTAVITAMVAGRSPDDIRTLVSSLIEKRQEMAA